ncbi:hypothetical protein E4U24_004885 [Claviceps purpurea]|nr:hypothetical protein E4U12_004529 [Claviceps purpurea]KAG6213769.1 hypothetical protein E4U50_000967 [Claviceps purpurea]KAG6244703.1 hypothetical protein E4U24_004885 [Claviceps purpurea]KAG6297927.1 hypothetical protein E4U46_002246 [Claviceps purpurea]
MPFNKSRPTRPFISGHDAPSVQGKRESSTADADEQQTGRKSLQLLNARHDAAYNVCKGQLEQGTVSCPELTAVAYDGNNNPLTQRSRKTVGRRISRSVPRPDKSRSIKDKCLQLVQQWTQKRIKWNISFFGEPFPMRDGQGRRIQAQDSRGRLDSCETYTHPAHSPLGTEAMGSLARAGMMLATEDLDRLSERARVYQEVVEEQQTEGFRTDKVGNAG